MTFIFQQEEVVERHCREVNKDSIWYGPGILSLTNTAVLGLKVFLLKLQKHDSHHRCGVALTGPNGATHESVLFVLF